MRNLGSSKARTIFATCLALAGLLALPALAEPPCRPFQNPFCLIDDLWPPPIPTLPPYPTVPPIPTIPPIPTYSPGPFPSIPPIPSYSPGPFPSIPPIPSYSPGPFPSIPPIPTYSPGPFPTIPAIPITGARSPWIPANAGVMWYGPGAFSAFPAQPVGEAGGSLWLTRRIGVSPHSPTNMLMGSFLNGAYVSQGGAAWVSATPGCLMPAVSPAGFQEVWSFSRALLMAGSGLDVCGVEGIAYDPLVPGRVYISAYDAPTLSTISPGGVYVSDDGGFHWRKLLGGIRGAGLAVGRPGGLSATIVAGYIQQTNVNVGVTPGNGSLSISTNDGASWRNVILPASGCADGVGTSQRLTATVAFNAVDQKIVYAGTNAGLYVSTDTGATWRLARQACGGLWGIGAARDGRVFFGDNSGAVYESDAAATSLRLITDVGDGYVQSVEADLLNPSRIYAAVWSGGASSVYRIESATGATTKMGDSLLPDVSFMPQPFPFAFNGRNGTAPSLFLARPPGRLYVSTVTRGAFMRGE